MTNARANRTRSEAQLRKDQSAPKTVDYSDIDFDIFKDLLSFYYRSVSLALNRDYDSKIGKVSLARGTGTVSTLLLVGANPGIRPSVIAHFIWRKKSRAWFSHLVMPLVGAAVVLYVLVNAELNAKIAGSVWLAIGLCVLIWFRMSGRSASLPAE